MACYGLRIPFSGFNCDADLPTPQPYEVKPALPIAGSKQLTQSRLS